MVFAMARPTAARAGRLPNFRRRIPAKFRETARGRVFIFRLPPAPGEKRGPEFRARESQGEIKFSLQTRDPSLVKQRQAACHLQFDQHMEQLESAPIELSNMQRSAFAGVVYKTFAAGLSEEPVFSTGHWSNIADSINYDREHPSPLMIPCPGNSNPALELRMGNILDYFLDREGLKITERSRSALLDRVAKDLEENARLLARYADGDYSTDEYAKRFPDWKAPAPAPKAQSEPPTGITFQALFDRWNREAKPATRTLQTYRAYWFGFKDFVGHDKPAAVTEADVIHWKDHLVDEGKSPASSHLSVLRVLFSYAVQNAAVTGVKTNPALDVRMAKRKRRKSELATAYDTREVASILRSAKTETNAVRRWVPWLLALSGARVGEITQLWGSSIIEQDGYPCMSITPAADGGSIKNGGSERIVPIHPAIIEQGFIQFVADRGPGPLFYRPMTADAQRKVEARRTNHPSKKIGERLASWIRGDLGFKDPRKAPNHAFRHWFKSECARPDMNIQDSLANVIQGHADKDVASGYRHFQIRDMAVAISRIEVPLPA